jgi:molybdopterin/thiamine biosynthesis adenylyltransferase
MRGLIVVGVLALVRFQEALNDLMTGGLGGKVVAYLALAVVGLPLTLAGLGLTQVENVLRQRYRDWAAGRVQAQVAR